MVGTRYPGMRTREEKAETSGRLARNREISKPEPANGDHAVVRAIREVQSSLRMAWERWYLC